MTIINTLPFDLQNGTTADATQVMADFDGIVDDVNANAAHNGANNDITSLSGLTTPLTPAQGGTTNYIGTTSAGTANAQTISVSPTGFGLTNGYRVTFIAGFTNTGATTLKVDATTIKSIFKPSPSGPVALAGGELTAGNTVEVIYDGTQFVLTTKAYFDGGVGARTNINSATTTDLGTLPTHFATVVLSATPITSFGSSASAVFPIYYLSFQAGITLTYNASTMILPGQQDIVTRAGDSAVALYAGSSVWVVLSYSRRDGTPVAFSPTFLRGYIDGLTLSAAGSTGTFGIAAGEATDSTNAGIVMLLASAYTKTTASWAVGTGNGGLDTGAIATGTWYHAYTIYRPDTGVTDVLFSLSATAPTLPANYTLYRRIGSMKTDGSSQWLAFTQTGDQFIWSAHITDTFTATNSRTTHTLTAVPTGVVVQNLARLVCSAGGTNSLAIMSLQEADYAVSGGTPDADVVQNVGGEIGTMNIQRLTNTSAQICSRASNAGVGFSLYGYGWIDRRGKS